MSGAGRTEPVEVMGVGVRKQTTPPFDQSAYPSQPHHTPIYTYTYTSISTTIGTLTIDASS